jgi:hypothetical protein
MWVGSCASSSFFLAGLDVPRCHGIHQGSGTCKAAKEIDDMPRYIDADLPCVSDDRPSRRELAAERDSEKYDEGYSDGHAIGHDEGRSDMHAEVMTAIREMMEAHADDERDYTAADVISMVHDAVMALADDAGVCGE